MTIPSHPKSIMKRHELSHTGDKPYTCGDCGKSYADPQRLKDHAMSHTGLLPYSCDFCGSSFRRKDHVMNHIKRVHHELSAADSKNVLTTRKFQPPGVNITPKKGAKVKNRFSAAGGIGQAQSGPGSTGSNGGVGGGSCAIQTSHIVGHINEDGTIRPVANSSATHPSNPHESNTGEAKRSHSASSAADL